MTTSLVFAAPTSTTLTSRDFCYWLQGLFELGETTQLDTRQTDLVKLHLAMVFKHEIDPSAGGAEHQAELSAIHSGESTAEPPTPASIAESVKQLEDRLKKVEVRPRPPFRDDVILRC